MIVEFTEQDREQIKSLHSEYDQKIKEVEALIDKLAPATDFDENQEREILNSLPDMPDPVKYSDDGTPIYSKEAIDAYNEEQKKVNAELDQLFETWLDSGAPGFREARKERSRLISAQSDAVNALLKQIERREFSKLNGDRAKIIQSAKEQVKLLIDKRIKNYDTIIETHQNEDGEEISSFSARDLRVDGKKIYLDSQIVIEDSKRSLLALHYEALSHDQEAIREIDEIVLTVVSESPKVSSDKGILGETITFKKKRKSRSKKEIPTFSEQVDTNFFMFSTTPMKDVIFNVFSNDGDMKETALKMNSVSKRKTAQVYTGENSKAISVNTANSQTIIELLGSACQKVNSRTSKKILHFIESELYQRTYYKGKMNDDIVTFPLQKMVDKNLYTSIQNARRAFYDASNVLTALRVSATLKSGKKEISVSEGNARIVLFPTMLVENGQCVVRLSRDINWSPLLKDFFLMPDSWWSLPDNASDLEYKIFRAIRLNKEKIKKDGSLSFNISLKTVATWLVLPLDTKNPKRNVKDPIETAVRQISESLDPKNFKIKIKTNLNASLTQYLEGYLEITIGGVYTQNLISLNERQQARIEKNVKRKEEIIKEASIRKLVETIKEEEKKESKNAE